MDLNFSCDTEFPQETLADLRKRLIRRLGFSAQANNPPPGMAELMDDFLAEAQRLLYTGQHRSLFRSKRWFTWTLVPGERFYGFTDNDSDGCSKTLEPDSIDWIGTSDGDNVWLPMTRGIDPRAFQEDFAQSRPYRFELSQGIEVWPAPDDANIQLRVRGHFGLLPFAADADKTTIDPDLLFLRALTLGKAHYGKQDASAIAQLEMERIGELVANTHNQRRYIPRALYEYCCGPNYNPGIFGAWGVRYLEGGDVRVIEEA